VFAAGVCLRLFLMRFTEWNKRSVRWLFAIAHTLLMLVPLGEILYYQTHIHGISPAECVAMMQASMLDIKALYLEHLRFGGLLLTMVFLVLLLSFFYRQNKMRLTLEETVAATTVPEGNFVPRLPRGAALALLAVIFLAAGAYGSQILRDTGVVGSYYTAREYFKIADRFKANHAEAFASLRVKPSKPLFGSPSTIVLVIGDSASRTFMEAYGYKDFANTPWMSRVTRSASQSVEAAAQPDAESENFLLFRHAYSVSDGAAVSPLTFALTQASVHDAAVGGAKNEELARALSLLDLANKAGYETWWFSNQPRYGGENSLVTQIGLSADHSFWLEENLSRRYRVSYDSDLVPCLQQVDPARDNFVVLHLGGSHEIYMNRYPRYAAKFSEPGQFTLVRNYADSIAYTDEVLRKIYEYASAHLNMQAFIYTSGSGQNPYSKRMTSEPPFLSARIPLLIWLSDEYKSLYPARAQTLATNRSAYWTNDMLYDLVGGIMDLKSASIDENADLASPAYAYNRDNLKIYSRGKTLTLSQDALEEKVEYGKP